MFFISYAMSEFVLIYASSSNAIKHTCIHPYNHMCIHVWKLRLHNAFANNIHMYVMHGHTHTYTCTYTCICICMYTLLLVLTCLQEARNSEHADGQSTTSAANIKALQETMQVLLACQDEYANAALVHTATQTVMQVKHSNGLTQ